MATVHMDSEEIAKLIRPVVREVIQDVFAELKKKAEQQELKEVKMLSRKEIIQIFNCSKSKASIIMSKLPKVQEVGHYCVPEHSLKVWIDQNTEWVRENTGYFGDFEGTELHEVM